jgi:head-tail adaptor
MGIGAWRTRAEFLTPVHTPAPDGSYTETLVPLVPQFQDVGIRPAGARDLERLTAGTVTSTAGFVIETWWHPGVTMETVLRVPGAAGARLLSVLYVGNPDGQSTYLELLVAERVL